MLRRNHIKTLDHCLKRHAHNVLLSIRTNINVLETNISQRQILVDQLPFELREPFISYVNSIVSTRIDKKPNCLLKSLNHESSQLLFPPNPQQFVHNLFSVSVSNDAMEVLSLGITFCDKQYKCNRLELETQFEMLAPQTHDLIPSTQVNAEDFKSTLVDSCFQYQRQYKHSRSILKQRHRNALKELKTNRSIILSKPDKGSGIVILNKSDYVSKVESCLSDRTKFQSLSTNKDETDKVEKQLTYCLKQLLTEGYISGTTYEELRPTGSTIPRLYGLPKIHKDNVPIRPILSMSGSAFHSTARWLVKLLEPLRQVISPFSLRDTFTFVEKVKGLNVSMFKMASLDVSSLFTNVPLLETIDYICERIEALKYPIGIPITSLRELLLRCTLNVQFLFNGNYYRQIDGVAMGSPLGPLFADIFMSKIETLKLHDTICNFKFYGRYVDDIFIVHDRNVEHIIDIFNTAHSAINFTSESEKDGSLPFLDVLLERRDDGSIRRSVYHKPTWSGQYLHFNSAVPMNRKRNLIKTLANRVYKISSEDSISSDLLTLKDTLRMNGYPDKLIERNIVLPSPKEVSFLAPKKPLYINVPYLNDIASQLLERKLKAAVKRTYYSANLILRFQSKPVIVPQLKDRLPTTASNMVLYEFKCCCAATYIGQTTRQLAKRVKEHLPAWYYRNECRVSNSSILNHLLDEGCNGGHVTSFRVIYRVPPNPSKFLRKRILAAAEAIAIRLFDPSLCRQKRLAQSLSLPWPEVNPTVSLSHTQRLTPTQTCPHASNRTNTD